MKTSIALLVCLALASCVYDAPPDVERLEAEGGVYRAGDPIDLRFSEPVDPATLSIRIWPAHWDIEGRLLRDEGPLLNSCAFSAAPCGPTTLTAIEFDEFGAPSPVTDGLSLDGIRIQLDPAGLGRPNNPVVLEVQSGLADLAGNATGIPSLYDLKFLPQDTGPSSDVKFENGTYVCVGTLEEPIPGVVITLITSFVADSTGMLVLAAADGDPIGGAPKNTTDPSLLEVDGGEHGFVLFAQGSLSASQGERYFESQPVPLNIGLGNINVTLTDFAMSGAIVKDGDNDRLDGVFSWASLDLEVMGNVTPHGPGSTSFVGIYAPTGTEPEGTPDVCGDLCGAVTAQCTPPADFPPEGVCP